MNGIPQYRVQNLKSDLEGIGVDLDNLEAYIAGTSGAADTGLESYITGTSNDLYATKADMNGDAGEDFASDIFYADGAISCSGEVLLSGDVTAYRGLDVRGKLEVGGSIEKFVTVTTASLELNTTVHSVIVCNNTSGITVTLPSASNNSGLQYIIKRKNTGSVTISGTVDGESNPLIPTRYTSFNIISDGTNWNFI